MTRAIRSHAFTLTLLTAAAALAPAALQGQRPTDTPQPPPYYAIVDARVVPVSGPVIERGTVVVARGRIAAVGTDVQVPVEAWVIDGEGLTVYPGLIDALSDLGLRGGGEDRGGPGGGDSPPARGPEDRPATTPWVTAADRLAADDGRVERWRQGGFTAAVSAPTDGLVPGQAAVVSLAGDPRDMVLATPVALRLNLRGPGGFGSFPGSLMGVLSYMEQLFLDARHHAQARAAYEARPRAMERPRYDRTLEPIHRLVSEGRPLLIPASEPQELLRAAALAERLGARAVLYGGHGAWQAAEELAGRVGGVLVSLKWPEGARDPAPDADPSLRELRRRAHAPSAPAALHRAGIPFAFYSDGVSSPADARKAVAKAVEAGLPADAALRALTLGAAQLFGVADRLGSVEEGKVAHLVVTDGDLLEEDTKVRMVFVDGVKFEHREPARPDDPPAADLSGTWTLTTETPQGTQESTLELTMAEDGTLSGSVRGPRGEGSLSSGWVSGNRVSFTVSLEVGPRTVEATYTGTFEGDEMKGQVSFGRMSADFSARRPGAEGGGR